MKSGVELRFDRVHTLYLIPTVYIMPDLAVWDGDAQRWSKTHKAVSINVAVLIFEFAIEITHAVKK